MFTISTEVEIQIVKEYLNNLQFINTGIANVRIGHAKVLNARN